MDISCLDVLIKSNRNIRKNQISAGNRGNIKKQEKYHVLSAFYVCQRTNHAPTPMPIISKLQHLSQGSCLISHQTIGNLASFREKPPGAIRESRNRRRRNRVLDADRAAAKGCSATGYTPPSAGSIRRDARPRKGSQAIFFFAQGVRFRGQKHLYIMRGKSEKSASDDKHLRA